MKLVGCDFHTRFQAIAMVDTESGELEERRLNHEGKEVERFYGGLGGPTVVGIESTGYSIWFHEVMDKLGGTTASGRRGEDPSAAGPQEEE